jgi:hypothetical protein
MAHLTKKASRNDAFQRTVRNRGPYLALVDDRTERGESQRDAESVCYLVPERSALADPTLRLRTASHSPRGRDLPQRLRLPEIAIFGPQMRVSQRRVQTHRPWNSAKHSSACGSRRHTGCACYSGLGAQPSNRGRVEGCSIVAETGPVSTRRNRRRKSVLSMGAALAERGSTKRRCNIP